MKLSKLHTVSYQLVIIVHITNTRCSRIRHTINAMDEMIGKKVMIISSKVLLQRNTKEAAMHQLFNYNNTFAVCYQQQHGNLPIQTRDIYSIHVQYYPQCIPRDHIDVGLGMGLTPLSTPRPLHPVHHSVMLLTI